MVNMLYQCWVEDCDMVSTDTPIPSFARAVQVAVQYSVLDLQGVDFDEHSIACSAGAQQVDQSEDDSPMGPT